MEQEPLVPPLVPSAALVQSVLVRLAALPSWHRALLAAALPDRRERSSPLHRLEAVEPSVRRRRFPSSGRLRILGFSWVFSI